MRRRARRGCRSPRPPNCWAHCPTILRSTCSRRRAALCGRLPPGQALIRHAANLIGNLDRAQADIEAIEGGLSGTVAMGAGIGACYVLVPRALALLLDRAPDVAVTMREGAMEEHFAMLRDGRLELVVGRVEPALVDRDFLLSELYDPAVHIVAGPQHPLAKARSVSWASLVEQDWILPQRRERRCAPASSASSGG